MQEQSTPWMVLSIKYTLKHGAFTGSWIGQQEQVTWTHHLIFLELCVPKNRQNSTVTRKLKLTCHLSEEQVSQQK
jgi:hypothetical protein